MTAKTMRAAASLATPAGMVPFVPSPTAQYAAMPMSTARMVRKNSAPRRLRGTQVGWLLMPAPPRETHDTKVPA